MPIHSIPPVFDNNSKILILGSFPSVKSREQKFYYGHPQNRFWKVVANVFNCSLPASTEEKKQLLINNYIALWDVIASCDIKGSSDSTIKNVVPNDLRKVLDSATIEKIFVNGKTAEKYYNKYSLPDTNKSAILLPSTSPANAMWTIDRLICEWQQIRQ